MWFSKKEGKKKRIPCAILFENTEGIGNVSPTASTSFSDPLFLWFSFFSETRGLCPLAGSNLNHQRCLQLSGLGPSHPLAGWFCEQSLCQEFLKHRESFVRKWEICWFLQFLFPWLPETQSSVLSDCGAHSLVKQRVGEERLAVSSAFLAGSKKPWLTGWEGPSSWSWHREGIRVSALRRQSCAEGQIHPYPCSEHVLSQTLNLHCLSLKQKKKAANFCSLPSHERTPAFGAWIWFWFSSFAHY